jgi:uncharacterized protein
MIRVDIETIIMAAGPIPSVIVLRERAASESSSAPLRALSIQTGSYEAAGISRGINGDDGDRPITADITIDIIKSLGARVERVEINRVDAPLFYASIVLAREDAPSVTIDARPSDAIALAVRVNAPIFVEDDVMNRAGSISYRGESDDEAEQEKFDQFVQTLSPDDF